MTIEDLIGKPYRRGGRGPDHYDCAGLAIEVQRRRGNAIAIPDTGAHDELPMRRILRAEWIPVPRAYRGVLAFFRPSHVGTMLDARRVLHASEERGQVCIEYIDAPYLRPTLGGFYEYAGGLL